MKGSYTVLNFYRTLWRESVLKYVIYFNFYNFLKIIFLFIIHEGNALKHFFVIFNLVRMHFFIWESSSLTFWSYIFTVITKDTWNNFLSLCCLIHKWIKSYLYMPSTFFCEGKKMQRNCNSLWHLFSYKKIWLFQVKLGCCSISKAIPIFIGRGLCFFFTYAVWDMHRILFDFGPIFFKKNQI